MLNQELKKEQEGTKKKGRKKKGEREKFVVNKEQTKFFVDLTGDKSALTQVFNLLESSNNKGRGSEITFKDLACFGLGLITDKNIEKIKESSLSKMEKVERALEEHNKKNNVNLNLGEYLVKKLSI
jgi:hypothetical protein